MFFLQLTVVQQDIATIVADAIVHPTNSNMTIMGEVGKALEKVGGKEFLKDVDNLAKTNSSLAACDGKY